MNTTQLECFVTVANFLNFSRAAEQLRITQPAVSHQINSLEDELGVKLFHRTSKSVRLTQEGFLFLQYAGEILKLSALSKARLKQARATLPTRLVIGCRNMMELRFLSPALQTMRQTDSSLLPVLRLIPFDSLENLLRDGDIDVLFSFQPPDSSRLKTRLLARCPVMCVCSPDHPLAEYDRLTVEQLHSGGRIAVCRPPISPQPIFTLQGQAAGSREPGQILFCDQQEVSFTLAEAGYAFTVTADLPHARISGLRYIPVPEFPALPFYAVFLADNRRRSLRQFLDLLTVSPESAEQ